MTLKIYLLWGKILKNDYKIKSNSKVKINSTTEENELLYKIKLDIDNGIGEISLNFR